MVRRSAVVRAAVAATLCASIGVPTVSAAAADPPGALADARARWESRDAENYSYRVQIKCNACWGENGKPKIVRVIAGKPRPLPAHFRPYDTVDELFSLVQAAIADAAEVSVSYASRTGVPTSIEIDQSAASIDDEFSVRVTRIEAPRK